MLQERTEGDGAVRTDGTTGISPHPTRSSLCNSETPARYTVPAQLRICAYQAP